jgi:PPK2 family polyphosphate:nucleotide phosphotransferase
MPAIAWTSPPGTPIRLNELDPAFHDPQFDKESARRRIAENVKVLDRLGYRLYAENRRSLLLVLQGMDTSGKDGVIRKVMRGFNPQGCQVVPFKQPSPEELDHDFLWRIHQAVPRRGNIGIFNRSHYEDVLVVRVQELVPREEWQARYRQINEFEELLTTGRTTIVKCFLFISKEEQRKRLQARLDNPEKHWKFSHDDLDKRKKWDDYLAAYEDALTFCNTLHAPWYIVPSDRKWYRDLVVSETLRMRLEAMDPQIPPPAEDLAGVKVT